MRRVAVSIVLAVQNPALAAEADQPAQAAEMDAGQLAEADAGQAAEPDSEQLAETRAGQPAETHAEAEAERPATDTHATPPANPEARKTAAPRRTRHPVKSAAKKKTASTAQKPAAARSSAKEAGAAAGTEAEAVLSPPLLSGNRGPESIGSLSVGHPHQGYLFNAVKMPKGPEWVVSAPQHAYGTEETIQSLIHCIRHVQELFPHSPPVFIGSISPEHGGFAPPHKSHQSGRDVDLYFYYKPGTTPWYKPAGPHNLDRPRTWALLRSVITDTDVDFVLIDRSVQALLEEYALSIGEDRKWIADLFHGSGRYPNPLIKHVPGHTAHMHIRFVSRVSRERGRLAYDGLVELGHIELPSHGIEHTVAQGDTLIDIAKKYGTTVERVIESNALTSSTIRVGQVLKIQDRQDLRGAQDPIVTPPRRLPPGEPRREDPTTLAALSDLEQKLSKVLEFDSPRPAGNARAKNARSKKTDHHQ